MASRARPEFNPHKPFVVTRPFTAAGIDHQPGAPFDWRALEVTERQLRLIWQSRNIDVAEPLTADNVAMGMPARPLVTEVHQRLEAAKAGKRKASTGA